MTVAFIHRSAHDFLMDNTAAQEFLAVSGVSNGEMQVSIATVLLKFSSCPLLIGRDLNNG